MYACTYVITYAVCQDFFSLLHQVFHLIPNIVYFLSLLLLDLLVPILTLEKYIKYGYTGNESKFVKEVGIVIKSKETHISS